LFLNFMLFYSTQNITIIDAWIRVSLKIIVIPSFLFIHFFLAVLLLVAILAFTASVQGFNWTHPGVLVSLEQLDFIKSQVCAIIKGRMRGGKVKGEGKKRKFNP
jgi:hypothetical protein